MKLSALLGCLLFMGIAGQVIAQDAAKPAGDVSYIGVAKCKMCHAKQHVTWMKMKHSTAITALSAEEQKKPECFKCHVTGYGETGPMRGVAWFTHDDPTDRPPERFDGTNTLYTGGARESYLLMPLLS